MEMRGSGEAAGEMAGERALTMESRERLYESSSSEGSADLESRPMSFCVSSKESDSRDSSGEAFSAALYLKYRN